LICLVVLTAASLTAGEIESFAEPYRTIDVAAVESGLLVDLLVEEGAEVKKGQPIAELNQDVIKATLEIARAGRDGLSALKAAEAELRLRENQLNKLKELRKGDNASEEEVNRAALEFELAQSRVLLAREQLEVKKLEFDRIQFQLDQRTVKSPIDGVVTQIHKDAGEFLSPTEPVVLTVVQLDPLTVTFSVPASQISELKAKRRIPLRIDGVKEPREADVELVSQVINAESQTVRVKVKLANPKYELRSGVKCFLSLPDAAPTTPKSVADKPKSNGIAPKGVAVQPEKPSQQKK
jgi:RND family efflux transporter MFP subunit